MPMTLEQFVEEASQLPGDVVSELVDRIMLAKYGGEEVSAQIRKIVGW